MKIFGKNVHLFKIRNRRGYAAVCNGCLTEGSTKNQAIDRMVKATALNARHTGKVIKRYPPRLLGYTSVEKTLPLNSLACISDKWG